MNSQTKTTSMTAPDSTPHNLDAQRLHDVLALQKYAYQRYPLPEPPKNGLTVWHG
ncbi:hypothetical protein AB2762_02960 [Acinetobacter indicus]